MDSEGSDNDNVEQSVHQVIVSTIVTPVRKKLFFTGTSRETNSTKI